MDIGISFNPYTGKQLTAEDIRKIDSSEYGGNEDGKVTLDELKNYMDTYEFTTGNSTENEIQETDTSNQNGEVYFDESEILEDTVDNNTSAYHSVTDDMKNNALEDCKLDSQYNKTGLKSKKNCKSSELYKNIENDLRNFAESLKKELKNIYGSEYNEAKIQEYIDRAIDETVLDARNVASDYDNDSVSSSIAFAQYSVSYVVDKFITNFNEIQEADKSNQNEEKFFDKTEILKDGKFFNKYDNGWKTSDVLGTLDKLKASTKASIMKHCPNLSEAQVDEILDDAKNDVIDTITYKGDTGWDKFYTERFRANIDDMEVGMKYLIDLYLDKVEERIKE